jgi:hypothetical protein
MILLEVDPDLVKPGWTPLIITLLLGVAVALLFVSMRRQFRKISIPRDDEDEDDDQSVPPADQPPEATRDAPGATPSDARITPEDPPAR